MSVERGEEEVKRKSIMETEIASDPGTCDYCVCKQYQELPITMFDDHTQVFAKCAACHIVYKYCEKE